MPEVQDSIQRVFVDSMAAVTKKVIGFSLEHCEEEKKFQNYQNVSIQAKGIFRASLFFSMDEEFEQAIFLAMGKRLSAGEELKDLLIGEYINIISGHALTEINNITGKTSRLTIPKVGLSDWKDEKRYSERCTICFCSVHGTLRLDMSYEWDY